MNRNRRTARCGCSRPHRGGCRKRPTGRWPRPARVGLCPVRHRGAGRPVGTSRSRPNRRGRSGAAGPAPVDGQDPVAVSQPGLGRGTSADRLGHHQRVAGPHAEEHAQHGVLAGSAHFRGQRRRRGGGDVAGEGVALETVGLEGGEEAADRPTPRTGAMSAFGGRTGRRPTATTRTRTPACSPRWKRCGWCSASTKCRRSGRRGRIDLVQAVPVGAAAAGEPGGGTGMLVKSRRLPSLLPTIR